MQVYKTFLKIAKKRFPSVILYFVIFLILAVIMSFNAESEANAYFQSSSVSMCIIDHDQSTSSTALYDYMDSLHTLVSFESYDTQTLQDNLFYEQISYVLTIPKGFEEQLLNGRYDNLVQTSQRPGQTKGYFIDQQIDHYLKALSSYLVGGESLDNAIIATNQSLTEVPLATSISFDDNATKKDTKMFYFFQYMPYVLLMILFMGLSPIIITFRKKDLGNRIQCSALHARSKNIQIGLGCITYSFLIWIIFILLAILLYGPAQIFSSYGLLCMLNSLVFVCITTALTLIIGSFQVNYNALNMISNVVGLGMSFLCGIFVPQWFLGEKLLLFSRFLPAYWYVRITNMLSGFSGETVSMNTYWSCIGIQCLFFLVFFFIYLAINRQQKKIALV